MSTAAPAPVLHAPPRAAVRRHAVGYWIAAAVAVLGLAAAIGYFSAAAFRAVGAPDDFARAAIPGTVVAHVTDPGTQVVYYEGNGAPASNDLGLAATAPGGADVALKLFDGDLRYDVPGRPGVVAKAVASFDAKVAGTYRVTATAPDQRSAELAVGEDIGRNLASSATWAGVAVLLSAAAASAIALNTHRRRAEAHATATRDRGAQIGT
jgi:hypothetical protein